jgi:putative phage-type endonuclease
MNAPTRAEFLERRRSGIGGSDIPAILGISPWRTPLDVYRAKVEPQQDADDEQSEPAYWGTVLEDVVAREYAMRTGARIQRVNTQLRHPRVDCMVANIDRAIVLPGTRARLDAQGLLVGATGILECKTANAFKASDWGRDGDDEAIPVHYAAQGMAYLSVTGLPYCDFAVLIGGQRFVTKRLERDEAVIREIEQRVAAWWADHVEARIPPPPQNAEDITALFPSDNGETVEADEQLLIDFNEAVAMREQIERLETDLEQRVNAMKLAIGEASAIGINGRPIVTWKRSKGSSKTDWKKAAHDIKGWLIEQQIDGGVDAVRALIDAATTETEGVRRFVFVKQK